MNLTKLLNVVSLTLLVCLLAWAGYWPLTQTTRDTLGALPKSGFGIWDFVFSLIAIVMVIVIWAISRSIKTWPTDSTPLAHKYLLLTMVVYCLMIIAPVLIERSVMQYEPRRLILSPKDES